MVPGPVDISRKRIMQAVYLGWFDITFGFMLEERIGRSLIVVKRLNADALGEYYYGNCKDKLYLIYISIGVDIGCSLVVKGVLYDSTNGSAGEIGHTIINPNEYRCNCGNYDYLETLASIPAIVLRAKKRAKSQRNTLLVKRTGNNLQSLTIGMIIEAARQGDAVSIGVIQKASSHLGLAISNLPNIVNPSWVVIGGELISLGELYLNPIRQVVHRCTAPTALASVEVVSGFLDDQTATIWVATLAIDHFFDLSEIYTESRERQWSAIPTS